MTLREIFPEWWCKVIFSFSENCYGNHNWLDFTIYELIFTAGIFLVIKWTIHFLFFILGLIIPNKSFDATIVSPKFLEEDSEIPNDVIENIEIDEDLFSLEEESNRLTKRQVDSVEDIDKEIETSIVNITRKGVNN